MSRACTISYFIVYELLWGSSCSCWDIYHENEVPEPEDLSWERELSLGVCVRASTNGGL